MSEDLGPRHPPGLRPVPFWSPRGLLNPRSFQGGAGTLPAHVCGTERPRGFSSIDSHLKFQFPQNQQMLGYKGLLIKCHQGKGTKILVLSRLQFSAQVAQYPQESRAAFAGHPSMSHFTVEQ